MIQRQALIIVNKPPKRGLPLYYNTKLMSEASSDKKSKADSINENPMIFDHLFMSKLKGTKSNLTPKKRLNHKKHKNETIKKIQNSFVNMNAEIIALKSFVKEELYGLNKSTHRVRNKQCNQGDFIEEMKKMLNKRLNTKTEINKTLSEH